MGQMPDTRQPSLTRQQLSLSEGQECEVRDWAAKERSSGTVVSHQHIERFAQGVSRRDGVDEGLALDFDVHGFLERHADLAKRLTVPTAPDHRRPETNTGAGRGAPRRLTEMRQRDATFARFGDSPPPPREPAPYPQGEIIHQCLSRYVVRHGDVVTKYTTHPHGLDGSGHPNEALALAFVKEHTTIPVPNLVSSDWDRVTMEFIEGQTLQQAWPVLTASERSGILAQLKDYLGQMRALGGVHLGRLDGRGVVVPSIFTRCGGPFGSLVDFHDWLVRPPKRLDAQSIYWHQITAQLGTDYPIVFTHGDLAARNIIIRDGHIVAILDWEFAGWYPEYWEYVFTMRGMDRLDWETLGLHAPSLFPTHYDLEYILVEFILRIS